MEEDLRRFIESTADSDVKKELILYFHENPAIDSASGLAVWINRTTEEIIKEIDVLVDAQILKRTGEGRDAVYMYSPSETQRKRVDRFVKFYKADRITAEDEIARLRLSLADVAKSSILEIQREQTKTKTILTSMADGVIVTDPQHRIVLYNPAAARLVGIEGGIGLGRRLRDCSDDEGIQQLAQYAEDALNSPKTMSAHEVKLSDPREVFLKAHLSPIREETTSLGVVTVLRDITDLKQLDKQRIEFIHMVSHELRSPLTSIRGFVQSILRGIFGEITQDQQEPLSIVEQQSERLLTLINDLLDMARIDAGTKELNFEPTDLRIMIHDAVNLLRPQAADKKHHIEVDIAESLPTIDADPDAIEHVLTNLLSNAIKYTLPGGKIVIRAMDRGENVVIEVWDTGIGIPPYAIPKLFDRFYRVKDPKMREVTGTGLGLSIVRNYVEAHMGTVSVKSEVDAGTTFIITLPKRHESRQPSEIQTQIESVTGGW